MRLHVLLRRRPAHGEPPPQGAPRGGLGHARSAAASWVWYRLRPEARRAVPPDRRRARARGRRPGRQGAPRGAAARLGPPVWVDGLRTIRGWRPRTSRRRAARTPVPSRRSGSVAAPAVADRLGVPWVRPAARRGLVLAEPPAVRLAEPRLAPLPRRARRDRHRRPLRRARVRPVGLAGRRLLARGAARRTSRPSSRRPASSGSRCSGCPVDRPWRWPTPRAHPERVTRLVLYGTVCGVPPAFSGDELAEEETYRSMIRVGWAKEDPVFRRVFTTRFIPDATEEQLPGSTTSSGCRPRPGTPSRAGSRGRQVEIDDEIPAIRAPTIVLQATGDRSTTFDNAVHVVLADPGRAARAAREPQPHPARRRAGVARVHDRGRGVPRAGPAGRDGAAAGAGRGAVAAGARRAAARARTGAPTTRSRSSWRSASGRSSATCRTRTGSSGVTGRAARAAAVAGLLRGRVG